MKSMLLLMDSMIYFDRQVLQGIKSKLDELSIKVDLHLESSLSGEFVQSRDWDWMIADYNKLDNVSLLNTLSRRSVVFNSHHCEDLPPRVSSVTIDNMGLADTALQDLVRTGFQKVGFYANQQDQHAQWSRERQHSFIDSAKRDNRTIITDIEEAIELRDFPLGVYCSSDRSARKLVNLCSQLSVNIPEEVAIIGTDYDDTERMLSSLLLSSVALEPADLGKLCVETLMKSQRFKKVERALFSSYRLIHGRTTAPKVAPDKVVIKAEAFIRNHFHRNIKIKSVLEHCGVSRKTLDQRFLQHHGITAHQFLTEQRLERAKFLLKNSLDSIDSIAKQCGYPSQSYLSQLFVKQTGHTPNQYRLS